MPFRTKVVLLYAGFLTLIIVAFSVAITGAIKPTIIASIDKSLETVSAAVLSNIHAVPESASNRNDAACMWWAKITCACLAFRCKYGKRTMAMKR